MTAVCCCAPSRALQPGKDAQLADMAEAAAQPGEDTTSQDTGSRIHRGRHRVQHFQYGSQTCRARIALQFASRYPGEKIRHSIHQRNHANGRRKPVATRSDNGRRESRQCFLLRGGCPRPFAHAGRGRGARRLLRRFGDVYQQRRKPRSRTKPAAPCSPAPRSCKRARRGTIRAKRSPHWRPIRADAHSSISAISTTSSARCKPIRRATICLGTTAPTTARTAPGAA